MKRNPKGVPSLLFSSTFFINRWNTKRGFSAYLVITFSNNFTIKLFKTVCSSDINDTYFGDERRVAIIRTIKSLPYLSDTGLLQGQH